jgi:inositol-phosphate transport system ATP-binding protein
MVFQDFVLFPHMTVAENIAYGIRGLKSDRQKRVLELLDLVSLSHLSDQMPHQISGGEQQRVALARSLAPRPQLILMDEPFSNLDHQLRVQLRQEIHGILKHEGVPTILVTHDQSEAMAIADRIALINEGRIQQVGRPDDVYNEPVNTFVASFLGTPPMNLLEGTLDPSEPLAYVRGGVIEVPSDLHRKAVSLGLERVIVGFRPEHARVVAGERERGIPGRIYTVEPMGRELLVVVQVGEEGSEELVRLLVPLEGYKAVTRMLESEEQVRVIPERDNIKLFNPDTGKSVSYL